MRIHLEMNNGPVLPWLPLYSYQCHTRRIPGIIHVMSIDPTGCQGELVVHPGGVRSRTSERRESAITGDTCYCHTDIPNTGVAGPDGVMLNVSVAHELALQVRRSDVLWSVSTRY